MIPDRIESLRLEGRRLAYAVYTGTAGADRQVIGMRLRRCIDDLAALALGHGRGPVELDPLAVSAAHATTDVDGLVREPSSLDDAPTYECDEGK